MTRVGWPATGFFTDTDSVFDPVTNQIANQAAKRAANARRPLDQRARAAEKGARAPEADSDSFENALERVEATAPTRPLADADREDAREDRIAGEGRSYDADRAPDRPPGSLDLTA